MGSVVPRGVRSPGQRLGQHMERARGFVFLRGDPRPLDQNKGPRSCTVLKVEDIVSRPSMSTSDSPPASETVTDCRGLDGAYATALLAR